MNKYKIEFYFSSTYSQSIEKGASNEAELDNIIQQRGYIKSDPKVDEKTIVINMSNVLFYTISRVK